ncbi:hypothetical protein [Sporosarcina psychrophila]|uniref:Uncharacterized protein n=1 Tax=Sporosarcina psychrophila TaxID=1476 RepID=A0ABV2KAT5_SPOPS
MNITDSEMVRAKGIPAPQYFNEKTGRFEPITGRNGANAFIEKGRVVKDYFEGRETVTKTYDTPMFGFGIVNDGVADLTFTINGMQIPVRENEGWDDLFEPFTTVTINATGPFRAVVRE